MYYVPTFYIHYPFFTAALYTFYKPRPQPWYKLQCLLVVYRATIKNFCHVYISVQSECRGVHAQ